MAFGVAADALLIILWYRRGNIAPSMTISINTLLSCENFQLSEFNATLIYTLSF